MAGDFLRKEAFWMLDFFRGAKIRNAQKDIYSILDGTDYCNTPELNTLLKHSINTVPYYHERINDSRIENFPVVSKDLYRKDFDSFRSKLFLDDKYLHKVYTSGSTGNPFMAFQDSTKLIYHRAGLITMNNSIGWQLGAKYMFIRAWGTHESGKLKNIATNVVPVEAMNMTDEDAARICEKIRKDKSLRLILGYASSLERIADYAIRNCYSSDELGIDLIISDSECLKADVKIKIKRAFECPVLNRYANNENGILAITDDKTDCFHVNYPEYYVEVLKLYSDNQADIGEIGRIIVTDLYNKAFPFIRYDTGDLGIASEKCGHQVVVLSEIIGRVSDMLTATDGTMLGEAVITAIFENYMPLRRYQIIQKASKYMMLIEKPFSGNETEVISRLHRLFGENADITIVYTDRILCGKNGKYKTTIKRN